MRPIYKEKYVLSKEAYGYFTIDQNKEKLEKNKRGIKLTAWVQIIVGILFVASQVFLGYNSDLFVLSVFAVIMVGVGIHGLVKKYPDYEKKIWANVETSYKGKGFDDSWFEIKFFEDEMQYTIGENIDRASYSDFYRFLDEEKYFGLHFITGSLILFNPDCNREKIKEIITTSRKNMGEKEETAEISEETAVAETSEKDAE